MTGLILTEIWLFTAYRPPFGGMYQVSSDILTLSTIQRTRMPHPVIDFGKCE